jgi:hypothetical protein
MGCVTATAKRRRREMKIDKRYRYGSRSIEASAKRLARTLATERAIKSRGKK